VKKCLLTLMSLASLSHLPLHSGDNDNNNNKTMGVLAFGAVLTTGVLVYCYGDNVKNYWYGTQATNSDITYEPSLQEALSNSTHNSSRSEQSETTEQSQPTIIEEIQKTEHKANQELSTALQTTQQRAEVIGRKIIQTAHQCGGDIWEIFKNRSATEHFTKYPLD